MQANLRAETRLEEHHRLLVRERLGVAQPGPQLGESIQVGGIELGGAIEAVDRGLGAVANDWNPKNFDRLLIHERPHGEGKPFILSDRSRAAIGVEKAATWWGPILPRRGIAAKARRMFGTQARDSD